MATSPCIKGSSNTPVMSVVTSALPFHGMSSNGLISGSMREPPAPQPKLVGKAERRESVEARFSNSTRLFWEYGEGEQKLYSHYLGIKDDGMMDCHRLHRRLEIRTWVMRLLVERNDGSSTAEKCLLENPCARGVFGDMVAHEPKNFVIMMSGLG